MVVGGANLDLKIYPPNLVDQVGFGNSGWVWWVRLGLEVSLGLVGQVGFAKSGWVCFHWLILPCIALIPKLEFRWVGWVGGANQ